MGTFNQEKALVGAFSVIVKSLRRFVWSSSAVPAWIIITPPALIREMQISNLSTFAFQRLIFCTNMNCVSWHLIPFITDIMWDCEREWRKDIQSCEGKISKTRLQNADIITKFLSQLTLHGKHHIIYIYCIRHGPPDHMMPMCSRITVCI